MNIARFSVTRPVAVMMRILSLVLLGAICLTLLPVDLLPNVTLPTVAVFTNWPNVAPEEIETQVTRPLEELLSQAPNMYEIDSTTSEGASIIRVQFRWGTDIGQAAVDVLQLVQRAQRLFPSDPTLQTPTVFKFDPSLLPIMILGVSGESDPVRLRTLLDNQVTPILEAAGGVASAVVTGGEQRAIMVDVDPNRLQAHNVALADVVRRLIAENQNLPAGIAKQSKTEYLIRTLGWFTSPQQIADVPVGTFNGRTVSVGDVATVSDSHQETRLYTRLNLAPAAGVIISKQSGANTISTANAVLQQLKEVQRLYPQLHFRVAYDQSQFISASVADVARNALLGGVLAVLILLFFLRNVRSTLVVALSIPISIISTFALIYFAGFSLNTMSLGGLALATGLIVDDAVVVLENIFRHIERDRKPAPEAAESGTNEITSAVLASTLTVVVVFVPLLLIKGQAGAMFTQFALVVIFALAVSLLDALTVVPMLASRLISGEAHREQAEGTRRHGLLDRMFVRFGAWLNSLDESHHRALQWALGHRALVIGGALAITAASLLLVPFIGTELLPPTDSGNFNVIVKMPPGTALSETNAVVRRVERVVLDNPDVKTVFAAAGTTLSIVGSTTNTVSSNGSMSVSLKDNRKHSTLDVIETLRRQLSQLPGATIQLYQVDLVSQIISGGNQTVDVDIFGDDLGTLYQTAQQVIARVRDIPGYENVDVNWQESSPELQWHIERRKAVQMGVTFPDVANTINTATNGTLASYYQENGYQYPIIVELPPADRKTEAQLMDLVVTPSLAAAGAGGSRPTVLLRQVATPTFGVGPSQVTRLDRQRFIAVSGQPQGRPAGAVQADIQRALAGLRLPPGYRWDWGTAQKRRTQEFAGLALAVFLAIGLIYMLLASEFESLIHPLTVLLCVPLAALGVVLALFLTGRAFGLTAFIGLLMLVGIVVKNGILLVDYTNILRHRGMERNEAVLTAAPTRLRPILMTASAATLGMLPLALALGRGSETQAPLATAVIGGLVTSTILTLIVVPTVYTVLDDLTAAYRRRRGRA